jgi:ABC-type branched-subunit amino acid transport system ATPase component
MSVEDNLLLGAYKRRRRRSAYLDQQEFVYALFPRLKERRKQAAGRCPVASARCWRWGAPDGQAAGADAG